MIYTIETIGYGRARRYCIKQAYSNATLPTDGIPYTTEQDARAAAAVKGYEIACVGDFYHITKQARIAEEKAQQEARL